MTPDWIIWQLADSAFPTGGFAHSGGLEAAVQLGLVSDPESFELFLKSALPQIDRGIARFAQASWQSPDAFPAIDQDCDLFLNNHVANRASRAQGQALLSSATKAFKEIAHASLPQCAAAVRQQHLPAHFAPVFGVLSRAIRIPAPQSHNLFLFLHLRGFISAAVRLGIIGPLQAQQIQSRTTPISGVPASAGTSPAPTPVQINPLLDLIQMTQDRLYSRLFQS
jgi:urease accessory protein